MKKIILFFTIIIFTTGCNNDYELYIEKDKFTENINFKLEDNDYDKAILINELFNISDYYLDNDKEMGKSIIRTIKNDNLSPFEEENNNYYNKKKKNNEINLSYKYDYNSFKKSKVFDSCFGNTYYDETKDYYVIKGYNSYKCLIKDKMKIVIKTKYRVINTNADRVIGNKYIWYFNNKNNLDKNLYIQISKKIKGNRKNIFPLIAAFIIGGVLLIYKLINSNLFGIRSNNEL